MFLSFGILTGGGRKKGKVFLSFGILSGGGRNNILRNRLDFKCIPLHLIICKRLDVCTSIDEKAIQNNRVNQTNFQILSNSCRAYVSPDKYKNLLGLLIGTIPFGTPSIQIISIIFMLLNKDPCRVF